MTAFREGDRATARSGSASPGLRAQPRLPATARGMLRGEAAPPVAFTLELPTTADFQPGGLGRQCAVLCKAGCCRYYSLQLQRPRSDADFDDVRWYLMHENTHVYKHEGGWYLLVLNECSNLLPNNLCGIYETRPRICREYDPTDCEYTGDVQYEQYFDTAAKLEEWLLQRKQARRQKARAARAATSRRAAKSPKSARSPKAAKSPKAATSPSTARSPKTASSPKPARRRVPAADPRGPVAKGIPRG